MAKDIASGQVVRLRRSWLETGLGCFGGVFIGMLIAMLVFSLGPESLLCEIVAICCPGLSAAVFGYLIGLGPKALIRHADIHEYVQHCGKCCRETWHVIRIYARVRRVSECEDCHHVAIER